MEQRAIMTPLIPVDTKATRVSVGCWLSLAKIEATFELYIRGKRKIHMKTDW
jgi:hypothetical protein